MLESLIVYSLKNSLVETFVYHYNISHHFLLLQSNLLSSMNLPLKVKMLIIKYKPNNLYDYDYITPAKAPNK